MRPILHWVLAMKMGHVPKESYTERIKQTQAKNHDYNGLLSGKCETTQQ